MLAYLTSGAAGLPFFIGGTYGIAKFVGPTAGYLVGFLVGAYTVSYVRTKYQINLAKISNTFLLVVLGQVIIYTFGILWLSQLIGFSKAIYSGCIVFIPSGIVKSFILSVVFRLAYVQRS
jgi:biotin transport system substrate-specific component